MVLSEKRKACNACACGKFCEQTDLLLLLLFYSEYAIAFSEFMVCSSMVCAFFVGAKRRLFKRRGEAVSPKKYEIFPISDDDRKQGISHQVDVNRLTFLGFSNVCPKNYPKNKNIPTFRITMSILMKSLGPEQLSRYHLKNFLGQFHDFFHPVHPCSFYSFTQKIQFLYFYMSQKLTKLP